MTGRIRQWWRFRRGQHDAAGRGMPDSSVVAVGVSVGDLLASEAASNLEPLAIADAAHASDAAHVAGTSPSYPEQPVLLNTAQNRPARVGELLPARRAPWPLSLVRLPAVPKRAILAAGVCAGLAGPAVARLLVSRVLFGKPVAVASGALEITRIIYTGPLTPQAAAAIGKALIAARR